MPLQNSASEQAFWANYHELIKSGYPKDQAMAIAAKKCRDAGGNPDKWLGGKK